MRYIVPVMLQRLNAWSSRVVSDCGQIISVAPEPPRFDEANAEPLIVFALDRSTLLFPSRSYQIVVVFPPS